MRITPQAIAVHYKKSTIGNQILAHRSENSVLDHPEGLVPYAVGSRKRLATCVGVSWIGNQHLATVNLYGHALRIYQVEEFIADGNKEYKLKLISEVNQDIDFPDALVVSGNGQWIAIAHSLEDQKGVTIRKLNLTNYQISPILERLSAPFTCHGVHFSPDSRFLAFTTLESPGTIEVYDFTSFPPTCTYVLTNDHLYLRPKDICFTSDSKYVAIIYSEIVMPQYEENNVVYRRLAIHRFNAINGIIDETSIAILHDNSFLVNSFELAVFSPNMYDGEYKIFITNQGADKVVEVNFNPVDNTVHIVGSHGYNLFFPHGIDISEDGKLLAVTNLGDDQLIIFKLEEEKHQKHSSHILLCAHSAYPQLYGAERSFVDLAKAFNRLGYKISCLLPQENIEYTNELAKYVDAVFHLPYSWYNHGKSLDDHWFNELESLIKNEKIDVVHINSTVIPDVLMAAKRTGIPGVLHARELLLEDAELTDSMGVRSDVLLSKLSNDADFIIANSNKTKEQFHCTSKIHCLYNAIEIDRFDIAPIAFVGVLRVGLISYNVPKKGIYDFIALAIASTSDPTLEFLMVGPFNPEIKQIQEEIKNFETIPRLRFIDYVPNPADAISMVDVVVNLSGIGESFGRTIAESMAARRPVIAYNRGAMAELISHEETGFLVPPGDISTVYHWIKWLTTHRAEAIEMGERGRQFVQKTFAFDLFQTKLESIYKKILK